MEKQTLRKELRDLVQSSAKVWSHRPFGQTLVASAAAAQ